MDNNYHLLLSSQFNCHFNNEENTYEYMYNCLLKISECHNLNALIETLYKSCSKGRDFIVHYLVEEKNVRNFDHSLGVACSNNHFDLAEYLLEKLSIEDKKIGSAEITLFECANVENIDGMKWILSKNLFSDKNEERRACESIFLSGCTFGRTKVVQFLISRISIKYVIQGLEWAYSENQSTIVNYITDLIRPC